MVSRPSEGRERVENVNAYGIRRFETTLSANARGNTIDGGAGSSKTNTNRIASQEEKSYDKKSVDNDTCGCYAAG